MTGKRLSRLAVIPARGGSKRIPRKNVRDFHGKPIIAYSIQAALSTGLFERVVVSTDDEEIAETATAHGADVPFLRPKDIADDYTGTNEVVRHALLWHREAGSVYDFACCIYATAPLLQGSDITRGYDCLVDNGAAFAFSVTTFPYPVQRALRVDDQGRLDAMFPDYRDARSQDLEECYHDAAQFYWGQAQAFIDRTPMMSPASCPVILPRSRVQDIDTEEDWERALNLYQLLQSA